MGSFGSFDGDDTSAYVRTIRGWIGLGEAAEMLGVAPTTLRRWADDGVVSSFVTPGGHRRFSRESIEALHRPGDASVPRWTVWAGRRSGWRARIAARIGPERTRRGSERWTARSATRCGSAAGCSLRRCSPTSTPRTGAERKARLDEAPTVAAEYGRLARVHGATVHQTVATYLRFSRPFVAEIATFARRRSLDTAEAT